MTTTAFHSDWLWQEGTEGIYDSRVPFVPGGTPGLPAPLVYDIGEAALRLREMSFAAKRLVDMIHVTGLSEAEAMTRLVWRGVGSPGGLSGKPDVSGRQARLGAAHGDGAITIAHNAEARRVAVTWTDAALGAPITGAAIAPPGWGGIVLGAHETPEFVPAPIKRAAPRPETAWPLGDAVTPAGIGGGRFHDAVERFFAASPGAYGLLVARPDGVLFEQYGKGGAADRATPSWSMNKSFTGTLIGRLIQLGWLDGVNAPAPAPLWRDPRGIHAMITLDDLLRMRSGLGMAARDADGNTGVAFENAAVYFDGADAFDAAQRNLVLTRPGAVFRYVNAGINVLGAIIRERIEARGLPYHETLYGLLADRLGMPSYQISADLTGNLIASGAAFATLRDYAKLGVLYLNDGVWDGERLLPEGWADYALAPMHGGTNYAATFWTNTDRRFPALPPDAAWMSGASEQRVFILRRAGLVVAVSNETDVPMDLVALNTVLGAMLESV
jgi:CubicO group peptidase (beta-lactamase class C family)